MNTQETQVLQSTDSVSCVTEKYWWFWLRLLAFIVDTWFSLLILPIFYNIYIYYKEGTTIWYKATWLAIRLSNNEWLKPSRLILLWRYFAKTLLFSLIVWILRFIISIVFYIITLSIWESIFIDLIIKLVNRLLWVIAIFSIFGLFTWITIPFSKRKKAIHDMVVKTIVVRIWGYKKWLLTMWCVLFIIYIFINIFRIPQMIQEINVWSRIQQTEDLIQRE